MKAKKLIASLLACFVLLMGMAVVAFAEGNVAAIDGVEFPTLEAAVAEANDGDVITLISAANPTAAITVDDDITIDLNGQTLTLPVVSNYAIVIKGTLTIEDSVGTGKLTCAGQNVIGLSTSCTGGLNITGGNFESTNEVGYLIGAFGGEVNITGGNFEAVYCIVNCFDGYSATANISAGDFVVTGEGYWNDPLLGTNISVTGGTYSEAIPSDYLAEGTMTVKDADGNYVLATDAVAKANVDGADYATFEDAWENLDEWSTITLLDDVTLTEKLVVDKYIAVDGNGKTITTSAKKLFEVFADFDIYNANLVNTNSDGRCIDTRVDGIAVTIENCDMYSTGSAWAQTLTVGGSSMNGLDITITDSKIKSDNYTAIIMFVPANIEITNSEISGYAAIYAKGEAYSANTTGSVITVTGSDLVSMNDKTDQSNTFGTIVFEDDGVEMTVDAASSIKAETTGGTYQSAILFSSKNIESSITAACPITTVGEKASVLLKFEKGTVVVTNADAIKAVKAEGYIVADDGTVSVPEIRWITDTDAGFYMNAETKYGMMRFLFAVDVEGEIEATGIKYIKVNDKNAEGVLSGEGTASAFYGDVYGIPESENGNTYYAVAYVTTAAGTEWSNVVACTVDTESQQFTEYAPGGAQ